MQECSSSIGETFILTLNQMTSLNVSLADSNTNFLSALAAIAKAPRQQVNGHRRGTATAQGPRGVWELQGEEQKRFDFVLVGGGNS